MSATASGTALSEDQIPKGKQATAAIKVTAQETEHILLRRGDRVVPWYTQNAGAHPDAPIADWTWGPELMRTKPIANVGCGLTSAAMVLSYFGYAVTPGELNEYARNNDVYAPGSNAIGSWDKLFAYGGAALEYSRGTSANGRYLDRDAAQDPGKRKALFDRARALVKAGVPCIARVDYVGKTDEHYASWGDHFVVVVGVHRRGHLLINDPGRFFKSRDVGNGAQYPDLRANWLAEDPTKGTTKNGGYALVRIDTIRGSFHTSTIDDLPPAGDTRPPPSGTLDATRWKQWATDEVKRHATQFIPRLLTAARGAIASEINTRFAQVTANASVDFVLDARHLDLLVRQQAQNLVTEVHRDIETRIKSVVEGVKTYGFTPPVAIRVPAFLKDAIAGAVDGVVKTVAETISEGSDRFLDLAALVVPNLEFAAELARARDELGGLELPSLAFQLKRVTVDGEQMLGVTLHADLVEHLAGAAGWIDLDGEGELTFLFPSLAELADAILAKALSVLKLLLPGKTYLDGLVAAEDRARVERLRDGRLRLEVKADASAFSPAPILDALNVRGQATGTLVLDFDGTCAAVRVDVAGQAEVSAPGGVANVNLDAKGRLAVIAPNLFRRLWEAPKQGFQDLITQLTTTLEGDVRVTLRGKVALGIVDLAASANAALVIGFADRKAYLDFSAAGHGLADYEGHPVQLALRSGASARFEMPAPHTFLTFWGDPRSRLDELVTELGRSFEGQASVEVSARTETSIGVVRLSPQGKLALAWRGSRISVHVDASCATRIQHEGHDISLGLGGTAGATVEISDAPTFADFWRDARAAFSAFVERLVASFQAHASITVKAEDAFVSGLLQVRAGGTFMLELVGTEGLLRLDAAGTARQLDMNGEVVELALGGGADVRFDLSGIDLREVWRNPRDGFGLILRELPARLLGDVAIKVTAQAGIPIESGRLHVGGGLELAFNTAGARLRFLGGAKLALPGRDLELDLALDATASPASPWEHALEGEALATLWEHPEQQFQALIDKLFDDFRGHARMLVGVSGAAEGNLPGALGKLAGWRRADAAGELIIDYWAQDAEHWVTIGFKAAVVAGSQITVDSRGIGRITGRRLRALLADPDAELTAIASAFATETNVRLTFKDIVLRANVEKLYEAIQLFNQQHYIDGLVAVKDVAFVTLPGEPEKPLGLFELAKVAAHYAGWV